MKYALIIYNYGWVIPFLPGLVVWYTIKPAISYLDLLITTKTQHFYNLHDKLEQVTIVITSMIVWLLMMRVFEL